MSLYVVHKPVVKNTPDIAPNTTQVICRAGNVSKIQVVMPLNASMMVGVRVRDITGIIWPTFTSPSGWVTGNDEVITDDSGFFIQGPPYLAYVDIYNLDDFFTRTPEVRLFVDEH